MGMPEINLAKNLVPLQSFSLPHQHKCKELFGNPCEIQCKDNSGVYKNRVETDTRATSCIVDKKHQLPHKTKRELCRTCKQLSTSFFSDQHENSYLNENKPSRLCFYSLFVHLNRTRLEMGGSPISHSQACILMQDVLITLRDQVDKYLPVVGRNSLSQHLIASI
jgi:hypothetical protein